MALYGLPFLVGANPDIVRAIDLMSASPTRSNFGDSPNPVAPWLYQLLAFSVLISGCIPL